MTRVLFLTCHLPYPPISGGRLRELELLKRLAPCFDIDVCAVTKTFGEDAAQASMIEQYGIDVALFPAEPSRRNGKSVPHLPDQVLRHRSEPASAYVASVLERVDVVHVEGFYLMHLLPDPSPVPAVLVEQNVEYRLWLQRAESTRNGLRMHYLREFARTRDAESRAWRAADRCAVLTEEDREAILAVEPDLEVALVPDGIDHLPLAGPMRRTGPPSLVFVGNFGYEPNVDAAQYLCEDILPLVAEAVPNVHLTLVGNSGPPELGQLAGPQVTLTGRVPSVEPYLDAADVVVAPLRVGGGVKVKVLEALRRGKAIVTTGVGTQGLAGAEACVRQEDDPARFAQAVIDVLQRPAERRRLEAAAQAYAASLPTWDMSADLLAGLWERAVAARLQSRRVVSASTR
jgi:polysaccharide biosynthesis protein PslH